MQDNTRHNTNAAGRFGFAVCGWFLAGGAECVMCGGAWNGAPHVACGSMLHAVCKITGRVLGMVLARPLSTTTTAIVAHDTPPWFFSRSMTPPIEGQ